MGVGSTPDGHPRTSAYSARQAAALGKIVVLSETGEVIESRPLAGLETTIGRDGADIEFKDDPFMSPLHARISGVEGQYTLRDLGSRNGTWMFISEPHRLDDGDLVLIGSQVLLFRRLGYPGPQPPESDATRRMGSLVPSADIARLVQLRSDGSQRDTLHLSPGRHLGIGRERGDWVFPYDPSMSGLHAEIRSEDADFVICDAGSRNGVAISVRGKVTIDPGTRLLVGDKMIRLEAS
jgi:pSer/pThr/pTyr-binding forkhead associated (FHA) protein